MWLHDLFPGADPGINSGGGFLDCLQSKVLRAIEARIEGAKRPRIEGEMTEVRTEDV